MKQTDKKITLTSTVFCSRSTTTDQIALEDARIISTHLAKKGMTLANGAAKTGLMGYTARCAYEAKGNVYGIGLAHYEPTPHQYLTDWEGYYTHAERQERLLELGDFYIALEGGLGTIHEILDVHLRQFLGETSKPIIIVGNIGDLYNHICKEVKRKGLHHKLPEKIYFAKDGKEAITLIDQIDDELTASNYVPKVDYPSWTSEQIYNHLAKITKKHDILFNGIKMSVFPNVYPSNRFRSSKMLGKAIIGHVKGKVVADIACGHGTMGIIAAMHGAKEVVQSDINPSAVANAKYNSEQLQLKNVSTFKGNLFENIPDAYKKSFDLVIFNPPFHKEDIEGAQSDLQYAFRTDKLSVLDNFFKEVPHYLKDDGEILLGFSNKDQESLEKLERLMNANNLQVKMIERKNEDTAADNRIYRIVLKH